MDYELLLRNETDELCKKKDLKGLLNFHYDRLIEGSSVEPYYKDRFTEIAKEYIIRDYLFCSLSEFKLRFTEEYKNYCMVFKDSTVEQYADHLSILLSNLSFNRGSVLINLEGDKIDINPLISEQFRDEFQNSFLNKKGYLTQKRSKLRDPDRKSKVGKEKTDNQINTPKEENQNKGDLMTIKEVCDYFSVHRSTVHNWVKKGKLSKVGTGRRVYIKRDDVLEALRPLN